MSAFNVHIVSLQRILIGAQACGVDPMDVCGKARIPLEVSQALAGGPVLPQQTDGVNCSSTPNYLPINYHSSLWSSLTSWLPTTELCISSLNNFPSTGFGPIYFAAITAPSLYESIRQILSHYVLLTNRGYWEERASLNEVTFVWHRKINYVAQNFAEISNLLGAGQSINEVAGLHAPVIVRYNFKAEKPILGPDLSSELDAQIHFGSQEDSFTVSRNKLGIVPPMANAAMNDFLVNTLRKEVTDLNRDSNVAVKLRELIADKRDLANISLESLSDELKVSPRTLYRRLDSLNTSFSSELDEARKTRALTLVTTSNQSMLTIARSLGFSSSSAFARAFKRWYQSSPQQTRRNVTEI